MTLSDLSDEDIEKEMQRRRTSINSLMDDAYCD